MKQRTTLLLLAPALAAFAPTADRLAFGPESGTALAKSFSMSSDMSMDNMDMLMNGEPPPMDMEMEMDSTSLVEFSVTDEYVEVAGGELMKLARTFEDLEVSGDSRMSMAMMGEQEMSTSGDSELIGKTVVFTRDGDTGDTTVAFAEDSDGDDDLLEGLVAEFDFRALLPADAVDEGASWEIDPNQLLDVLAPCGDLKITTDVEGDQMGMSGGPDAGTNLRQQLGDIEGSAKATFTGYREVDGRKLAVIALEIDIETSKDLTEMSREMMEELDVELPEGATVEIESVDSELALEGEGQLTWDVAGGHFHAFSLSVEMSNTVDSAQSMSFGGNDMSQEMSMEMSGNMTFAAEAQRQ